MARISGFLGVWPNFAAGEEGMIYKDTDALKGMLYRAMAGAAQLPVTINMCWYVPFLSSTDSRDQEFEVW